VKLCEFWELQSGMGALYKLSKIRLHYRWQCQYDSTDGDKRKREGACLMVLTKNPAGVEKTLI